MTFHLKTGLASAALAAVATLSAPAFAADLGGYRGGSIKDGPAYAAPMPTSVGNCYFRADMGYSWSRDPSVKFPVGNTVNTFDGIDATTPGNFVGTSYTQTGSGVSDTSLENTWFGEGGFGCGSGSYGIRGELMFGYHGNRKLDGKPGDYTVNTVYTGAGAPAPIPAPAVEDPLHTTIKTYTAMANVYKDLGKFGAVTPYVGAGIGIAYNQMSETYFTQTTTLHNKIAGDNDISLAWSLMAGIGYQISDRAILDIGYRYLDMGKISSQRHDNAGFVNPRVTVDDLAAHEFKIGLRYHFGASDCCAQPSYAPMK
jgi:opacity protein-like surface antigen